MSQLTEFVIDQIDPQQYYDDTFADDQGRSTLHWPAGSEARTDCPFHPDGKTPSLHFNPKTGAWFCHGCSEGGNSIVSFHARYNDWTSNDAAIDLYDRYVRPVISDQLVAQWKRGLAKCPSALQYLKRERCLSNEVIDGRNLGWTGTRVVLPIYDEFGLCVNAKFHEPLARSHGVPKMVNYRERAKDGGNPSVFYAGDMLYPLDAFDLVQQAGYIVVCEGEYDALLLLSMGIPAITSTNGSKSWANQYSELFRGLVVIIAYDNDQDGINYARKVVVKRIKKYAKVIKRLTIPRIETTPGVFTKDVTDWYIHEPAVRNRAAWEREFESSRVVLENPADLIAEYEVEQVSLDEASRAKWFNRPIRVQGLVTGKDTAPYILPCHVRASCNKSCDHCPLSQGDKDYREVKLDPNDPQVLELVDKPENIVRRKLLGMAQLGDKPSCQGRIEILKTFNLEQLILIPGLDERSSQYVMRLAYYIGHGLPSNRTYNFDGTTTIHPQDQHSTHLFWGASPVQDQVETFNPTPETIELLRSTFGNLSTSASIPATTSPNGHQNPRTKTLSPPPSIGTKSSPSSSKFTPKSTPRLSRTTSSENTSRPASCLRALYTMADWQSRNVTKIRDRPDLHIAVDLVFHSVRGFVFNGEYVKRGMLDVLVVGDTRCGKGYVGEGLMRYYGLGEVASGESCSFAGLVGGLENIGRRFVIKWGIIPLNNGRFVLIDEASSLPESSIQNMSRVRSEGLAEINKIQTHRTQADVRLVWMANPRSGLPMAKHDSGLQVIKELIGANEDISRFDFALTVATNEVRSDVINAERSSDGESDREQFPPDVCRSLVMWAWSRKPEQVEFTKEATHEIISQAILFGKTYSPEVPLVQAENIRIKLAKISAAVAARLFATPDGEKLVVDTVHVRTACEFLHQVYRKPSMAYDRFSKQKAASNTVRDTVTIEEVFEKLGGEKAHAIQGLIELHRITPDGFADYVGDPQSAKNFIGDLVRLNCLQRFEQFGGWYLKNPEFTSWLRANSNGLHEPRKETHVQAPRNRGRRALRHHRNPD